MQIHGREIHFKRNMLANCKISDIVGGDTGRFGEIFNSMTSESIKKAAAFVCALNEGYIYSQKYEDPSFDESPITVGEILTLDESDYKMLLLEAIEAYTGEKPTIETEPMPAGKKTKEKGERKSS